MKWNDITTALKKFWKYVWEGDSLGSWIVAFILAFILIRYIFYPAIGFALGTSHPVVAVVSGSMEHKVVHPCIARTTGGTCVKVDKDIYTICGKSLSEKERLNLDEYWKHCGDWYDERGISKEAFSEYPFKNGFNTGDIIVLRGAEPENIKVGDVIVFANNVAYPVIHRVVASDESGFTTKGDHNSDSSPTETGIDENRYIGKALFRIPYVGWVKIGFTKLLQVLHIQELLYKTNIVR